VGAVAPAGRATVRAAAGARVPAVDRSRCRVCPASAARSSCP